MRIIGRSEIEARVEEGVINRDLYPSLLQQGDYSSYFYRFGNDPHSYSLFPIAAFCARVMFRGCPPIVYIANKSVWSSGVDPFMIEAFARTALSAGSGELKDGIFIETGAEDEPELATTVHLAMMNGWDLDVYSNSEVVQIEVDHDGAVLFLLREAHEKVLQDFLESTTKSLKVAGQVGRS